mgnify:CR=1 FL=1
MNLSVKKIKAKNSSPYLKKSSNEYDLKKEFFTKTLKTIIYYWKKL